jgi:hypothetical protein
MQNLLAKCVSVGAAAGLMGLALAGPSFAQDPYKGPHGHYNSLADFTRDVNGMPCGLNCRWAEHRRWANYYARHNWRAYYPAW